ncbi:hypothetical protein [Aliivibrio fischeri]|uniref:hypothetical protein n=1 Tax=Aliivibrio fischeri TaxID=668 RepID=UPI0012D8690D|nr:hypothetical protein [Aliivibrio fischeri]MUJ20452.1 hypothetical protein [Aliivibrio fischeri]
MINKFIKCALTGLLFAGLMGGTVFHTKKESQTVVERPLIQLDAGSSQAPSICLDNIKYLEYGAMMTPIVMSNGKAIRCDVSTTLIDKVDRYQKLCISNVVYYKIKNYRQKFVFPMYSKDTLLPMQC